MKDELRNSIKKIYPIQDDLVDAFLDLWQEFEAKRKEIITEADKTERYLYFVTKGSQKAYFLHDGREYIVAFSYPFAFTCIPESFLTQKPSKYYWECISDSNFLRISYSSFFDFVNTHKEFETLLWKKLLGTVNGLVNRYHRLLSLNMEERYRDLMLNSPQLLSFIPQKEIANYLKIDPTNFSNLINKIKI
jgi:CRP-like cAMP-binding protein